jgi:hypothetical protein
MVVPDPCGRGNRPGFAPGDGILDQSAEHDAHLVVIERFRCR